MVTTLGEGALIGGCRVRSLLFHATAFSAYSVVDDRGHSRCLLCAEARASRPDDEVFEATLDALKKLRSKQIPAVLGGGRDAAYSWILTEPIGATEPCWLPGSEALHWLRVMRVATRVADALADAEAIGLGHGSLEPACLRRHRNGLVYVVGVGAAALLGVDREAVLGSPRYVAPEQLVQDAGPMDAAADSYALGMWMFAALTGQEPFEDAPADELLAVARHGSPRIVPSILAPADVWEMIGMAADKRPEVRLGEWKYVVSMFRAITNRCVAHGTAEGGDPNLQAVCGEVLLEELGRLPARDVELFLKEHAESDREPEERDEPDKGSAPSEVASQILAGVGAELQVDAPSPPKKKIQKPRSRRAVAPADEPKQVVLPSILPLLRDPANDARRIWARRSWVTDALLGGVVLFAVLIGLKAWRARPLFALYLEVFPPVVLALPADPAPPAERGEPSKQQRGLPPKKSSGAPARPEDPGRGIFDIDAPVPYEPTK